MKHLLLIGAPGAGKGTVSKELKTFTQLSTGDMLRTEKKKDTPLAKKIASLIDQGKFVDNETMFDILKANMPEGQSLIFDGYPRNIGQIEYFENLISNQDDILVVYFNVDLDVLEDRIVNRLTCVDCGEIHNLKTNKPKHEGKCNECGGTVAPREDDNAEAFKKRLDTFVKDTLPIVDHFKNYNNYLEVDASGAPEEALVKVQDWLKDKCD